MAPGSMQVFPQLSLSNGGVVVMEALVGIMMGDGGIDVHCKGNRTANIIADTVLWIQENSLTNIPPEIGRLTANQLTCLPQEIGQLANASQGHVYLHSGAPRFAKRPL